MSINFAPFHTSSLSDFLFIISAQNRQILSGTLCAKLESRYMDCLDAYGVLKAREKCAEVLYDVAECSGHYAQRERVRAMVKERMKQYREGKLSKPFEEHPPLDSLLGLPI